MLWIQKNQSPPKSINLITCRNSPSPIISPKFTIHIISKSKRYLNSHRTKPMREIQNQNMKIEFANSLLTCSFVPVQKCEMREWGSHGGDRRFRYGGGRTREMRWDRDWWSKRNDELARSRSRTLRDSVTRNIFTLMSCLDWKKLN